jgi:hypothetical protein
MVASITRQQRNAEKLELQFLSRARMFLGRQIGQKQLES